MAHHVDRRSLVSRPATRHTPAIPRRVTSTPPSHTARGPDPEPLLAALTATRKRTLALLGPVAERDLEKVHSPLMSPLVWDLGHIGAFEDLWIAHRFADEPLLRPDLMQVYDAFETPRRSRGDLPYLHHEEAADYLAAVRVRTLAAVEAHGAADGFLLDLVVRHEQQHTETMLQTLELAHLERPYAAPASASAASAGGPPHPGLEWVEVPAGPCTIGAPSCAFSYDNERPRHAVELGGYRIGRTPVTNATFLAFAEGGGYQRREWWSDEGWAWKEEYDICRPAQWTADGHERRLGRLEPLEPDRPVVHVSWFEADAFARAHGARLPTEAEWERAATWDQETQTARPRPWGAESPEPQHANLDQLALGTSPVGAHPAGASPAHCLDMLGNVWEWTGSAFGGYPGFHPDPYSEYSEVFFGSDYRVLRGCSWATRAEVSSPFFRNWDFPARRQIFSGFRLAQDL